MLDAMRELSLLELNRRLGVSGKTLPELRRDHGADLSPLLVETAEKIPRVYLLQVDPRRPEIVKMWGNRLAPPAC